MTVSASDFADDIFNQLAIVGAIHEEEVEDEDLVDNSDLQRDYALAGIARLVEVKDAFEKYRQAVEDLAVSKGYSLQDGVFCEADERVKKALANVRTGEAHQG